MNHSTRRNFGRLQKRSAVFHRWSKEPDSVSIEELQMNADDFLIFLFDHAAQPFTKLLLHRVVQAAKSNSVSYTKLLTTLMRRCKTLTKVSLASDLSKLFFECLSWMPDLDSLVLSEVYDFACMIEDEKLKLKAADKLLLCSQLLDPLQRNAAPHQEVSYDDVADLSIPSSRAAYLNESDFIGSYEKKLKRLHAIRARMKIPSRDCAAHLRVTFDLMRADALGRVVESVKLFQDAMQTLLDRMNGARWHIQDHQVWSEVDMVQHEQEKATPMAFYDVRILAPLMSARDGPLYAFEVPQHNFFREQSFMQGNLVVFSAHYFELHTPIYSGIIVSVPGETQSAGVFGVRLLSTCFPLKLPFRELNGHQRKLSFEDHFRLSPKWTFIESPAFYKPYLSAMTNLRAWMKKVKNGGEIPMQNALLSGETEEWPAYVQSNPIFNVKDSVELMEGPDQKRNIDVSNLKAWTSRCQKWSLAKEEELNGRTKSCHALDETQLASLHHIFTNKVAVVEGVPGTGKTFDAMKFVQLLLTNRQLPGPIICMSFTNHTVTSFLNGITRMMTNPILSSKNTALLGHRRIDPLLAEKFEFNGARPPYSARKLEVPLTPELVGELPSSFVQRQTVSAFAEELRERITPHVQRWVRVALALPRNAKEHWKSVEGNINWIRSQEPLTRLVYHHWGATPEDGDVLRKLNDAVGVWLEDTSSAVKELGSKLQSKVRRLSEMCTETWRKPETYWITLWKAQVAEESLTGLRAFELWAHPKLPEVKNANDGWDFVSVWLPPELTACFLQPDGEARQKGPREMQPTNAALLQTLFHLSQPENMAEDQDAKSTFDEDRLKDITEYINRAIPFYAVNPSAVLLEDRELLHAALQFVHGQRRLSKQVETVNNWYAINTIKQTQQSLVRRNGQALHKMKLIVGTTDSIMSHADVLAYAHPSVLIVEEAAMVLESHVIAALQNSLQHVVLIGDHKQLRPRVMERTLALEKGLEVSLLERLYLSRAPSVTLTQQRRSHHSLASLLDRNYPDVRIENHPYTAHRKVLPLASKGGQGNRLYWMRYEPDENERQEQVDPETLSKYNIFECKAALALAIYVRQCYPLYTVVVLTPYAAQQQQERQLMAECPELFNIDPLFSDSLLQCRTIDNYQGEEADIVILSLTRTKHSGFLADAHRLCVALSRARMALYVVGCTKTVLECARVSPIMHEFARRALLSESCGDGFPGWCSTHRHQFTFADTDQLQLRRCREECGKRLPCGEHNCAEKCHASSEWKECPCADLPRSHQCSKCGKVNFSRCDKSADCPQFPRKLSCDHIVFSCLTTSKSALVCPVCS